MKSLSILNTGGTFNKRYNPIKGELIVPNDHEAVQSIIKSFYNLHIQIENIIHKDSLDFTDEDRASLLQSITKSEAKNIIIIHGTDTVDKSSQVIKEANINKRVVFVGSMVPFLIDKVEATANLSLAVGFLSAKPKNGVYIAMHGVIADCECLVKDRQKGQFVLRKKENR